MQSTIKKLAFFSAAVLGVALLATSPDVLAQADQIQDGINSVGGEDSPALESAVKDIINVLLFLIGALSVVMIIYGGFKYVTSAGESSAVASAKNTILYAVIGLVVAVSAFMIVNFVLGIFKDQPATNSNTATRDPRYNLSPNDPNYIGPTP